MYLNMSSKGLYMCDRDDHQDSIIESYAEEDVYNVSGTYFKWLDEHVRT